MIHEMILQVILIGERPGEPAHANRQTAARRFARRFINDRPKQDFADLRLEALRALSAAISRHPVDLDDQLVVMVHEAGWTISDLKLLFPTYDWRALLKTRRDAAN